MAQSLSLNEIFLSSCQSGAWKKQSFPPFVRVSGTGLQVDWACTKGGDSNPPWYNYTQWSLTCGSRFCVTYTAWKATTGMIIESGGFSSDKPFGSNPNGVVVEIGRANL